MLQTHIATANVYAHAERESHTPEETKNLKSKWTSRDLRPITRATDWVLIFYLFFYSIAKSILSCYWVFHRKKSLDTPISSVFFFFIVVAVRFGLDEWTIDGLWMAQWNAQRRHRSRYLIGETIDNVSMYLHNGIWTRRWRKLILQTATATAAAESNEMNIRVSVWVRTILNCTHLSIFQFVAKRFESSRCVYSIRCVCPWVLGSSGDLTEHSE